MKIFFKLKSNRESDSFVLEVSACREESMTGRIIAKNKGCDFSLGTVRKVWVSPWAFVFQSKQEKQIWEIYNGDLSEFDERLVITEIIEKKS